MTESTRFPASVSRAFERRDRALHLLDAEIETQLVPDCVHGVDFSRGETTLQLRVDGRSVLVRVHTWPDRWVWIDARHSVRGGWQWQFSAQGRFVHPGGARALATNVEKMLRAAHRPAAEVPDAMRAIWEGTLVAGNRRIA
jgi:hypothetical protein